MEFRTPAPARLQKNTFPLPQLESSIPWAPGRSHLPSCTPVHPTPWFTLPREGVISLIPPLEVGRQTQSTQQTCLCRCHHVGRGRARAPAVSSPGEGLLSQGEAKRLPLPVTEWGPCRAGVCSGLCLPPRPFLQCSLRGPQDNSPHAGQLRPSSGSSVLLCGLLIWNPGPFICATILVS